MRARRAAQTIESVTPSGGLGLRHGNPRTYEWKWIGSIEAPEHHYTVYQLNDRWFAVRIGEESVFEPLLEAYDERPELLRRHCADGGGFLLKGFQV